MILYVFNEPYKVDINRDLRLVQYKGDVYPTYLISVDSEGRNQYQYYSKHTGDLTETFGDDCRKLFSFVAQWRGLWDFRIYFKDEEYWAEEIDVMNHLWKQIENIIKNETELDD